MERFANATVEVAGIKVRGTVKSLDTGGSKKTGVVNGDGTTDTHEELTPSMLEIDVSFVTDVEIEALERVVDEPLLVRARNGIAYRIPKATYSEKGAISDQGVVNFKFVGNKAVRVK